MKLKQINFYLLITVFMAGGIIQIMSSLVGEIPEVRTEAYTTWEVTRVGLMFIFIWVLGYFTKAHKS